jgi:hypothetical protein
MIMDCSALLYAACPSGEHPGSVRATLNGLGQHRIIYPLEYDCGCEDPRK